MKLNKYLCLLMLATASMFMTSCSDDDEPMVDNEPDFSGTYVQSDQMGRPAINTVFVSEDQKDVFNTTTPSNMGAAFASAFESRLLALNPGYTTNALGLDATTFTSVLATDVLSVSTVGTTTFFDGTNVLTGRTLADDVIDVELILIFGGPDGTANPGLTSDNVDANDKPFLSSFPYLATPW
ncbi:MAG: DUF4331 family protein [Saprospiraceae bacterium]|nr:DUF4331 family protein [Saprospiraceae bacterium]